MLLQLVEDDYSLSEGIALALQTEQLQIVKNASLQEARSFYQQEIPDIIILDINLPDGSGYEYIKWVREQRPGNVPVLILTANDLEMDEITGLSLGADDYMTKPFRLAVLRARVEALLRRAAMEKAGKGSALYSAGAFYFDFDRLRFRCEGRELLLSVNEQKLLRLFVRNEGQLLPRELLMERIWSDGAEYVDENALSVTVNRLRSKLTVKGQESPIRTVYGQGYIWRGGSHVSD